MCGDGDNREASRIMKITITSNEWESLPEESQQQYTSVDNGTRYRLTEAMELIANERERLAEFRENNRRLASQVASMQTQIEQASGLRAVVGERTPEEIEQALARLTALEQSGVSAPDDVAARIEAAMAPLRTQVTTLVQTVQQKETQLQARELDGRLTQAAREGGVEPSMTEEFIGAARSAGARIVNDQVLFVDANNVQKYNNDGAPVTLSGFVDDLRTRKPRYFMASEGFDSTGRAGGQGQPVRQAKRVARKDAHAFLKEIAAGTVVIGD
jgi:hypothetical protein